MLCTRFPLSYRRRSFGLFLGACIGCSIWIALSGRNKTFRVIDTVEEHPKQKNGSILAPYMNRRWTTLQHKTNFNAEWFKDSLMYGTRKPGPVYLTIGIPSLVRPRKDRYIVKTLNLLLRHSTEEDRNDMVIVIFLGDFNDTLRKEAGLFLFNKYKEHVDSGLIQIIKANKSFYPDFDKVKQFSTDPLSKVKWHSKQNFDFGYMMLYSQSLSEFYLQLEDDVVTVPGYFKSMKTFIQEQRKDWVCLEFCVLGFIAKLYHSFHLEKLADMLMLFYNEHPNDVTYLEFNKLMFQPKRIVRKPSLFDHIGLHSSMALKMNSLSDNTFRANPQDIEDNDPDFKAPAKVSPYPPAKLSCSVRHYDLYTPEKFYTGIENVYFAMEPKTDDIFAIVFDTPQHMSSIEVVTGHELYPDDFAYDALLQLGTSADSSDSNKLRCTDIVQTCAFSKGVARIENIPKDPAIACVHLIFNKPQNHWILIAKLSMAFHKS